MWNSFLQIKVLILESKKRDVKNVPSWTDSSSIRHAYRHYLLCVTDIVTKGISEWKPGDLSSEISYFNNEGAKPCSNVKTVEIHLVEFLRNLQKQLLLSKVFLWVSLTIPAACVNTCYPWYRLLCLSMDIIQALYTDHHLINYRIL